MAACSCRTHSCSPGICTSSSGARGSPSSSSAPYIYPTDTEPRRRDTRSGGPTGGGGRGGSTRGEGGWELQEGGASRGRSSTYRDLLETHLLLAAVGFAAAVDLQRHDLPVAADVSEDLAAAARPDGSQSPGINTHTHTHRRIPAHLVFEERFHISRTHGVGMTGAGERRTLAAAAAHQTHAHVPRPHPEELAA